MRKSVQEQRAKEQQEILAVVLIGTLLVGHLIVFGVWALIERA